MREDEIYDWLTDKDNAALCDYAANPFEFVRKIIRSVEHYLAFIEGSGNDGKPSLAMDDPASSFAARAFSLHYVLLLAASELPEAAVRPLRAAARELPVLLHLHQDPDQRSGAEFLALGRRAAGDRRYRRSERAEGSDLTPSWPSGCRRTWTARSGARRRPEALHARHDAAIPDALPARQAHAARRDGVQGDERTGSLDEFTALEIEHILPDKPEADLRASFTAANSGKSYDEYKVRSAI